MSVVALYVTNLCVAAGPMTRACTTFFDTGKRSLDPTLLFWYWS